jgi:hypothetical protein
MIPINSSKITVSLPNGWTKVEGSVLEHQYMKGTASFMIKNEYVLDGKNLDDAIVEVKKTFEKSFKGISFSETENLQVDGHNAKGLNFIYSVSFGNSSMNMKMYCIYTSVNAKCYVISFADLEDMYDALSSNIQEIIKGIKFTY